MCTHTRQVEHQQCSRTVRVQKIHKILRKNTIFNEHPVGEEDGHPDRQHAEADPAEETSAPTTTTGHYQCHSLVLLDYCEFFLGD